MGRWETPSLEMVFPLDTCLANSFLASFLMLREQDLSIYNSS